MYPLLNYITHSQTIQGAALLISMMHRLRRYDVFRFAQNDVAPVGRNDAMFAQCAVRHTSLGVAVIIGVANIICRRQTSFKKRTFVSRRKCVFCCDKRVKRCLNKGKNEQKVSDFFVLLPDKLEFDGITTALSHWQS